MRRCAVGAGSLAELAQRCPPARFPALRSGIGALAAGGGVSAPWQVYKEIERKGDELLKWARENREMFEKGGDEVVDLAAKLMKKHKKNGQQERKRGKGGRVRCCTGRRMAAGRFGEEPVAVTEEGEGPGQIPRVAGSYGLRSIGIADTMREAGLNAWPLWLR